MNHKDWNYCDRSKILTHNSGLKIRIEYHRGNEISEITPIVPKDMNALESIRLIRDGTDYFRRNYHKIAQPQKRFDSVLSLKR